MMRLLYPQIEGRVQESHLNVERLLGDKDEWVQIISTQGLLTVYPLTPKIKAWLVVHDEHLVLNALKKKKLLQRAGTT